MGSGKPSDSVLDSGRGEKNGLNYGCRMEPPGRWRLGRAVRGVGEGVWKWDKRRTGEAVAISRLKTGGGTQGREAGLLFLTGK